MTVKILLLKSGEDVIADLKEMVSPDEKVIGYFLTKPCVVKLIPKDSEDEKDEKSEDSEEDADQDLSKVPPQLRKHVAKKKKMSESRLRKIIRQAITNELKGK